MRVQKEEYSHELQPFFTGTGVPYCQQNVEFVTVRSKENEVIAAGAAWMTECALPDRCFYVSVHPEYRRSGLGRTVYGALQMLHPKSRWRGVIDSDNESAARWLDRMGLECGKKCYIAEVNYAEMKEASRQKVTLTPLTDLSYRQYEMLGIMLYMDAMARNGQPFLPEAELQQALFISQAMEGIEAKESFCLIEKDVVSAYVLCYDGEERYTRRVGYVGHRMESREAFRQFLLTFAERSFETAGGLLIEAEDCDPAAMELLELFNAQIECSYDTYVAP